MDYFNSEFCTFEAKRSLREIVGNLTVVNSQLLCVKADYMKWNKIVRYRRAYNTLKNADSFFQISYNEKSFLEFQFPEYKAGFYTR